MNQLDPQVKAVWSLRYLFRTIILCIITFIFELYSVKAQFSILGLSFGILTLIVFVAGLIFSIVYSLLKYNYWKFEVRENELYLERGVLTRVKTIAPFKRIQHLDIQQSVFERMLNLAKLVVYTAGTRGADLVIPGLPIHYAESLRDQLKNYTDEDAV